MIAMMMKRRRRRLMDEMEAVITSSVGQFT
jgi:hypothetical protein